MTSNEIYDLINSISNADNIDIKAVEKQLLNDIIKQVNNNVITKGGRITGISGSVGRVVSKSIQSFYNSTAYRKSIASILKDISIASDAKVSFYKDADLEISKAALNSSQKIAINEFIDSSNADGLNAKFNQTFRTLIYESIRGNASQAELRTLLENKIISGKAPSEMAKYVKNISRQAATAYSSIVDQEIYKKFKTKITHYGIVGTLIDNSSPQCRQFIDKYDKEIPIDKLDEWIKFAQKNGGSPDLTAENLPVVKAHPGCRHQFIPLIK
jgi:hypothetical protein